MYETEIKVEIPATNLEQLLNVLRIRGFTDEGVVPQSDYYVKAVQSQYGSDPKAFDIERYRSEGGEKFLYTKKDWEVENGEPVRREQECEVSHAEFETVVANYPDALKIVKDRHNFSASFEDREISLSIDSVKFDHSPAVRHFMEPEILVADKSMVPETKQFLRRFTASLLGINVSEVVEAPGMFAMAFKKL